MLAVEDCSYLVQVERILFNRKGAMMVRIRLLRRRVELPDTWLVDVSLPISSANSATESMIAFGI